MRGGLVRLRVSFVFFVGFSLHALMIVGRRGMDYWFLIGTWTICFLRNARSECSTVCSPKNAPGTTFIARLSISGEYVRLLHRCYPDQVLGYFARLSSTLTHKKTKSHALPIYNVSLVTKSQPPIFVHQFESLLAPPLVPTGASSPWSPEPLSAAASEPLTAP